MEKTITIIVPNKLTESIKSRKLQVAAYCRVSKKSSELLSSLGNQIDYYKHHISINPNWTFSGIYYDIATGINIKCRSGYKQLIKDCESKKIDLILVKSVSRFGRDALESIRQMRKLRSIGVGIYVEIGGFNTMTTGNNVF